MRDAHQVATVRAAERALMDLVPDGALMQRAAAGLASVCATLLRRAPGFVYGARVAVLAGSGDNGGDALYAGATLARRGAAVTAIVTGPKTHQGGLAALRAAGGRVTDAAATGPVDAADLIIDGLLGIGGRGGLREPFAGLAARAGQARQDGATVVAVDLPSGIDADTGTVAGPAVKADVTVAFGTLKPGLLVDPGAGHAGTVELVDIGLGPYLPDEPVATAPQGDDIRALLPRPGAESDKYRRGVLGLLAGSDRYTGAALLSAGGAVHGGAGMIRVVTADVAAVLVRQAWPETVISVHPDDPDWDLPGSVGRVQAWVAGPGMGTDPGAVARLTAIVRTDLPVLVDADGLTILSQHRDLLPRNAPTLITPHAGELGRLLGAEPAEVEARRLEHARRAAAELGVTVLLKGSTTVIAAPDGGPVLVNPTGTPWLATAGSGDVLSGLAGALLAQGLPPAQAGLAAAYLHGLAGRLAAAPGASGDTAPIGASDLVRALPAAFRSL
ncbi:MAG TPA: NAD(P)H-hydrate dehydratase [Streptosporangiaceae bacterium]|nr:NAD(P)H-hydrate dehydratase [Streptosporangiaceae bacterium]